MKGNIMQERENFPRPNERLILMSIQVKTDAGDFLPEAIPECW